MTWTLPPGTKFVGGARFVGGVGTGRVLTGWGWTDPTNFDGEGFLDWELETILGAGNWRAGLEGTCWFIVCWFMTWACWFITWVCWTPEPWDINWGLIAVVWPWPWAWPKLGIVTGETFLTLSYLSNFSNLSRTHTVHNTNSVHYFLLSYCSCACVSFWLLMR